MDRKTLLTTLLIGGGTDAGTAIAQLQHAVSVLDETKADKTGTVALANNLTPYSADSGATQSVPFNNQGTGCGNGENIVDTGSYAQVKKKLGNTVCVNQPVKNGDFATGDTTNWSVVGTSTQTVSGGVLTMETSAVSALYQNVTFVKGHRYILCATLSATSNANVSFGIYKNSSSWNSKNITADGAKHIVFNNIDASSIADTDTFDVRVRHNDTNSATITIEKVWLVDLSLWYGSNDNIPAHLLSHPENFGRYYSGSLAYNPGQLVNADGSVLTSIGRNMWDERTRNGYYTNAGVFSANATYVANETPIPVIPNTEYYEAIAPASAAGRDIFFYDNEGNFIKKSSFYFNASFTTPSNCAYINFNFGAAYGTTYKNDFTISLYYPGESGYDQYYPFSVLAQIDTGSEVLRSAGAVADEKTPDGTITRRVGVVDLGTLTWEYSTYSGVSYFKSAIISGAKGCNNGETVNGRTPYYIAVPRAGVTAVTFVDKTFYMNDDGNIYLRDSAYTDAATFKTAMSGVYLYYELATPTTEQGTPFSGASADNFAIDDFGSMYWTQSAGVPQGVEIFYPYDYKAAVDTILNEVNGDVTKLVTAEKVPDAPSSNGTYVLKVMVSDGTPTYSWVADE